VECIVYFQKAILEGLKNVELIVILTLDNNQVPSRSRVRLEKLIVAYLLKKFLHFYGTRGFNVMFT
jgi:hypothetical protein